MQSETNKKTSTKKPYVSAKTGANGLYWMKLDNSAKLDPAARRRKWSNMFRLSATLYDEVNPDVLRSALKPTVKRFPSMYAKLKRGMFWYYLEEVSEVPELFEEQSYPLTYLSKEEASKCAFRVICYKKRIAVEFFHSLTDGTGGLIFLKTLVAEYICLRYGINIPCTDGVLNRLDTPTADELEDSFQRYSGDTPASRKENNAWEYSGTREEDGRLNLTCFKLNVKETINKAHEYGVTVNTLLAAVMMMSYQRLQVKIVPNIKKRKYIRILLPVNLRNLFKSSSLRNFALYITPEIDPRLGEYSLNEICDIVHHTVALEATTKVMSSKIAANVESERLLAVKILPLFIKNAVMKVVFNVVGEKKSCLSMSNLGLVKIPESMSEYIERFDFILGVQATRPHNCGIISYNNHLHINFIRNIKESELEAEFHSVLKELGLTVQVESNLH